MNALFLTAYEIECADRQRLFNEIEQRGIEARSIVSAGDTLRLQIPFMSVGRFERLLGEFGFAYKVESAGMFYRLLRLMKKRAGLIAGALICAAAIIISENYLLNIKILTDRGDIRSGVMNVLEEEGVGIGSHIPSLNCAEIERSLKQRVDGISWAGISKTDSTIIIDIIEKTEKPIFRRSRLPSDLVAKHSGTIDEIELYDGLLKIPIGSGVEKGEVIVSGRIPQTKTKVKDGKVITEQSERYVRSLGTAYGTYTVTRTFTQPYIEENMVMNGRRDDLCYLRVFGADIPLYLRKREGLFRESEEYAPLVVFDRKLPVGIKSVSREGYTFGKKLFSRDQAKEQAFRKMELYETDFLSDEKIISRKTDIFFGEDKVTLTAEYELYGVMTVEKQFFIKK